MSGRDQSNRIKEIVRLIATSKDNQSINQSINIRLFITKMTYHI